MDYDMLKRPVNVGFSGGEKKRNEMVQMGIVNPKFAILDETDSGLDIDALRVVGDGINRIMRAPDKAVLLITHYQRLLDYVEPDFVHVLADRRGQRAGSLSGGERQSVAMARALMMDPKVLLLDEPSAGLSPVRQDETFIRTRRINKAGVSVIMVEQNARRCLQICDRGYVLDQGRNAYSGTGRELADDPKVIELYLGTLAKDVDAS